jgi:hypothetical protein
MDSSFRCFVVLTATILFSLVAWRIARPAAARIPAHFGWRFLAPVTARFVDGESGVTITLSGSVAFDLPVSGGQISFEDRLNGELIEAGPPLEERGVGELRFREVLQRTERYPLTFSRVASTRVDGRLVCLSRFGLTAEGPGIFLARLSTTSPAQRQPLPSEVAGAPAANRVP